MLYRSFLFLVDHQSHTPQSGRHDDQRTAKAQNAVLVGRSPMGRLEGLVPARMRAILERRAAERILARAIARLSETAPHMLEDIGITLPSQFPSTTQHLAHLRTDVAVCEEKSHAVTREENSGTKVPVGRKALAAVGQ